MQFPGTRVQFSQSNLGSILNLVIIFPTLSMHDIIGRDGCDDISYKRQFGYCMAARSGDEDEHMKVNSALYHLQSCEVRCLSTFKFWKVQFSSMINFHLIIGNIAKWAPSQVFNFPKFSPSGKIEILRSSTFHWKGGKNSQTISLCTGSIYEGWFCSSWFALLTRSLPWDKLANFLQSFSED